MNTSASLMKRVLRGARQEAAQPPGEPPHGFSSRVAARWARTPPGSGIPWRLLEHLCGRAAALAGLVAVVAALFAWPLSPGASADDEADLAVQLDELTFNP